MPSMVLLIRSRLRIRPRSFSTRMPSNSAYWRFILRRPASSLGRSASSSASSAISPKLAYRSRLEVLLFRVLPIALLPECLTRSADVATGLFAHQVETLAPETSELGYLALPAAARTHVPVLQFAALFGGLCFLFCHCKP